MAEEVRLVVGEVRLVVGEVRLVVGEVRLVVGEVRLVVEGKRPEAGRNSPPRCQHYNHTIL
jgi:hypothetical protein